MEEPCLPLMAEGRRGERDAGGTGDGGVQGCRTLREYSPPPGDFSQQMSLFTHQIKAFPGSKGPLEKATAGYCLKMKYAASEEHFHLEIWVRAVYFYKDGMGWKFAVNLEEGVSGWAVPAAAPGPTLPYLACSFKVGNGGWMGASEGGGGKL